MIETPAQPQPKQSGLRARLLTAAIGIPLVLVLVRVGGPLFVAVTVLLAVLALRELVFAARAAGTPLMVEMAYPLLIVLLGALLFAHYQWINQEQDLHAILGVNAVLFAIPLALLVRAVFRFGSEKPVSLASVALTTFSVFYVGLFSCLSLLRLTPVHGEPLLWMLLLGVWAGDTVAYFAGRAWGRSKLTPLSPGKTVAGTFWGFVATFVVCFFVSADWFPVIDRAALGVLIALASPLGDLMESFLKRELKVKDFGATLPGHGGILDRCDSLILAAFVTFVYAVWRIIP